MPGPKTKDSFLWSSETYIEATRQYVFKIWISLNTYSIGKYLFIELLLSHYRKFNKRIHNMTDIKAFGFTLVYCHPNPSRLGQLDPQSNEFLLVRPFCKGQENLPGQITPATYNHVIERLLGNTLKIMSLRWPGLLLSPDTVCCFIYVWPSY